MKKRILLSLVSFFAVTAMWASIYDAYQIYVTAANGKTNATAELTLNMKNRNAIGTWSCTLVLPAGVTVESVTKVDARYPEAYDAEISYETNADGSVNISCAGVPGVALTGTDGAVATVTVKIADTATVGEAIVNVKNASLVEPVGTIHSREANEFKWTIEQGEAPSNPGDVNGDGATTIKDVVAVLEIMAADGYDPKADINGDGAVTIKDVVAVLEIMAAQ